MKYSNYLPKYSSPWIALLFFVLSFGYGKLPFTSIPLGVLVIVIDWRNLTRLCRTQTAKLHILFCILFFTYCFIRLTLDFNLFDLKTLSFLLALFYKSLIGLYFAYLLAYLMVFRSDLIGWYIIFQLGLIVTSAFDENVYQLLLNFQTEEAGAVFGDIFGLRSLGFGLMHNEGVVLLLLLYIVYFDFNNNKYKLFNYVLGVLMYLGSFSSRLILMFLPAWHIIKSFKLFFGAAISAMLIIINQDITTGPLSQVFEFYNYYENNGIIGTGSTDEISRMKFIPEEISTWIFGDGIFFENNDFYKNTDIGFSRIIFFGGLICLIFYILIFSWPLLIMNIGLYKSHTALIFFMIYIYGGSNVKGIAIQSFPFLFMIFYHRLINHQKSQI